MKTLKKKFAGAAVVIAILAVLFAAGSARAQEQDASKYANAPILVRTSQGDEDMHISANGCSMMGTGPATFIGMGDECWVWDDTGNVPRAMRVRITTDQVTFDGNGTRYLIHDAATVRQARSLFAPLEEIAGKQSALGAQQRTLGDKQRDFGRQQREVKVKVPDMSADFDKVEVDAKRLSAQGGTQSDLGDLQSELGELQSRIGELQSQAGEMQSKLGDEQSVLGDQQSALGEQQSELGTHGSEVAAQIVRNLKALLDNALRNGTAQKQ